MGHTSSKGSAWFCCAVEESAADHLLSRYASKIIFVLETTKKGSAEEQPVHLIIILNIN